MIKSFSFLIENYNQYFPKYNRLGYVEQFCSMFSSYKILRTSCISFLKLSILFYCSWLDLVLQEFIAQRRKEPFESGHFVFKYTATTSSSGFYPFTTVPRLEVCRAHNAQPRYGPAIRSSRPFNILSLCLNFSSSSLWGRSFSPSRPL